MGHWQGTFSPCCQTLPKSASHVVGRYSKTGGITFESVLTILEIFCHNFFVFFSTFFLQIFSHCQNLIHQISRRSKSGTHQEIRLCKNIVCSLARTIQEMSTNFKKFQSSYLQREYFYFIFFSALPPKIVFLPLKCLLFFHFYITTRVSKNCYVLFFSLEERA